MPDAPQVVGVEFHDLERAQFFTWAGAALPTGPVVAPTARGPLLGWVAERTAGDGLAECRLATLEDIKQHYRQRLFAAEVQQFAARKAQELELPMLFQDCLATLDGQTVVLFFRSPQRVDFRPLVHAVTTQYRKKIEIRQVRRNEG